jgi:hypothetical protein
VLVALASLAGCAFTDRHVHLKTTSSITLRGGRDREVVLFAVQDAREDTKRCGAVRNGSLVEMADVLCDPTPNLWLQDLVKRSLEQARFRVVTPQSASTPDPLRLHLTLNQLFVEHAQMTAQGPIGRPGVSEEFSFPALVADLHVAVLADTASGLSARRSFYIQKLNGTQVGFESFYQDTVDLASQDLADQIVVAVTALADRFPRVGTPAP